MIDYDDDYECEICGMSCPHHTNMDDDEPTEIINEDIEKVMKPYNIDFYSEKDVPKYEHNKLRQLREMLN